MTFSKKMALLCGSYFMTTTAVMASGYQLNEFSVTGLGRAFAGAGVVGDDYSAIAFNPAGMALKDSGFQAGVSMVQMHSMVNGSLKSAATGADIKSTPKGKMDLYKTLPHAFAQYKLNDEARIGFGVYTPFGLASDYNKDWFGATHGTKTELEVVDLAVAGSYSINKEVTLGASIINRYVHGDLNAETPYSATRGSNNQMDLDGWELAYNFGVMYEPVKDTRFGVSYRLNTAHKVSGKNRISGITGPAAGLNGEYEAWSKMTLPDTLTLSAFHKINDNFGLSASARWTKWSVFDDFVMHSQANGGTIANIPEKWKDVWTYSLGLDYYHNENLTFRTGMSYDPTPIREDVYRTARIPDSSRFWLSVGSSYKIDNMQFDLAYSHLFMDTERAYNRDGATILDTKHENYSNMFGAQFQYNF